MKDKDSLHSVRSNKEKLKAAKGGESAGPKKTTNHADTARSRLTITFTHAFYSQV